MANASVKGFKPVKYQNGASWNGAVNLYAIHTAEGTAINIGDLVRLNGGADGNGVKMISRAVTTNAGALVGVVIGKRATNPDNRGGATPTLDLPIYFAASAGVTNYAYVVDDPQVLFECQCDETTAIGVADIGLNSSIVVGSPATTGAANSVMELDASATAATSTLPLKIVEMVQREDNDKTAANQKVLVKINLHQYGNVIGTTGY